jgi:hypothetical protein
MIEVQAADEIQWGARFRLRGTSGTEIYKSWQPAALSVIHANQGAFDPPTLTVRWWWPWPRRTRPARRTIAQLVYRTVTYGSWQAEVPGYEWGVQHTWADGHVEVEPVDDRRQAERDVRIYQGAAAALVVSRTATFGDWHPVSALAALDYVRTNTGNVDGTPTARPDEGGARQ